MSYDRCPTCGEYDFTDRHRCPPSWRVGIVGYHFEMRDEECPVEDLMLIYARDPEQAAEKGADQYDSDGEYTVVGGSPVRVLVMGTESNEVYWFTVEGEAVPQYHATALQAADVEIEKLIHNQLTAKREAVYDTLSMSHDGLDFTITREDAGTRLVVKNDMALRKRWSGIVREVLNLGHDPWPVRRGGPYRGDFQTEGDDIVFWLEVKKSDG